MIKLQKNLPQGMNLLTVPCLCITLRQYGCADQEPQVDETCAAQMILAENLQDAIARSLPRLDFLSITSGPHFTVNSHFLYSNDEAYRKLPKRRTWWRIRRPEGGVPVAEPISHWKGERLRERLHDMSYDALINLKPHELEIGVD